MKNLPLGKVRVPGEMESKDVREKAHPILVVDGVSSELKTQQKVDSSAPESTVQPIVKCTSAEPEVASKGRKQLPHPISF